ncbi:MAG: helix-turn-helix transcriptional regulator [Patescibacteria group bacterium]
MVEQSAERRGPYSRRIRQEKRDSEGLDITTLGSFFDSKAQENGWTLKDVAERTGFTPSYVSKVFSGILKDPSARFTVYLGMHLGLSVEDLLPYSESQKLRSIRFRTRLERAKLENFSVDQILELLENRVVANPTLFPAIVQRLATAAVEAQKKVEPEKFPPGPRGLEGV